jgi:hypothetical protein
MLWMVAKKCDCALAALDAFLAENKVAWRQNLRASLLLSSHETPQRQ